MKSKLIVIPSPFIKVNIAKTDVKCGLIDYSLGLGFSDQGLVWLFFSFLCAVSLRSRNLPFSSRRKIVLCLNCLLLAFCRMLQDTELGGTIMLLQKHTP